MRRKTIAMFMLMSVISAGTLFAGPVSARNAVTRNNSFGETAIPQTSKLSANSLNASSLSCCSGLSVVTFQNYTPWKVLCYVDGTFVGVVYPGGALSSWTGAGWTRPYAKAVFLDGSSLSWDLGNVFYVAGGSYMFPMYP